MRSRLRPLGLALALGWSTPVAGQVPDWVNQVLVAADLPVSTAEARNEGASSDEIRQVLGVLESQKVPAHEARRVIDEERAARRDHGPVDNFGAFVQSRLQAGLRGQELAAAIRAEHAAHGKGKGRDDDRDRAQGKRPDEAQGGPGEKGRKDDRPGGKPEDKGKPEGAGKPGEKGKPADKPARPNN